MGKWVSLTWYICRLGRPTFVDDHATCQTVFAIVGLWPLFAHGVDNLFIYTTITYFLNSELKQRVIVKNMFSHKYIFWGILRVKGQHISDIPE